MKVTIEIADDLICEAKRVPEDSASLRALVEQGLRRVLEERRRGIVGSKLRKASFKGRGLQPGLESASMDRMQGVRSFLDKS